MPLKTPPRGAGVPPRMGRVRLAGVLAGLAMAAVLLLFGGSPVSERLFDQYQRWQPRPIAQTRVHIVRIDAESLRALGPWPWPRSYMALLTDRLREAGAAAVGFDIVFAEADPTSPGRFAEAYPGLGAAARAEIAGLQSLDEQFGAAIGRVPVVIARTGLAANSVEAQGIDAAGSAALPVEARFSAALPGGVAAFPLALANVDALEFAARGQGLINGEPDSDGVTRRVLLAATVAGPPTAGMALELARVAQGAMGGARGVDPVVVDGELRALRLGNDVIPVNPRGEARLWFGQLPDGSETSAVNIMRQPLRAGTLAGRIVLVGPASVGLGDVRITPLGRTEFGVRFHAQAVDAVLQGGWLARPRWAWAAEWGLAALLLGLAVWLVPGLRRRGAVIGPLLVLLAVPGLSWGAFALLRLLLDPLPPLLVSGGAGVAMAAMLFVETGRRARLLRDAALAQAGAMAAAREIQFAMLPGRDRLAALSDRIDMDAVLEPAQEIGGDLYDGFALPDGRIVFLVGDVTGKGPAAALFMAVSKALAHSLLRRGAAPLDVAISALNDELADDGLAVVEVTMLCGIIDPATGAIEMVNAGHENPLLLRGDGRIEPVAMEGGLPLCTMPGYPYPLERLQLAPGEALAIITDGVREAQDAAGNFFGNARGHAAIADWRTGQPASAITAALVAAVRGFEAGNPASDDLTVMAVCRRLV